MLKAMVSERECDGVESVIVTASLYEQQLTSKHRANVHKQAQGMENLGTILSNG